MVTKDGPSTLEYAKERVDLLAATLEKSEQATAERFRHLEQLFNVNAEAARRAIDKAESAQAAHNVAANEWRGTLNDFKTTLVGREEFQRLDRDFSAYRLEVSRIIAEQRGGKEVRAETKDSTQWFASNAIALIAAALGAAALIYRPSPTPAPAAAPATQSTPQVIVVPIPSATVTPMPAQQPAAK